MAQHSYGTKLSFDLDGTPPYTDLAQVKSVTLGGITTSATDVTYLEAPNAARVFIPGLADAGEITAEIQMADTSITSLYALYRTVYYWKITAPVASGDTNGATWVCQGFLSNIGNSYEEDSAILIPITIKLTGKPTFTEGS